MATTAHEKRNLWVVGGGGHAKVAIATARAGGWCVAGIYDDAGSSVLGVPVIGVVADARERVNQAAIVAIGNNQVRKRLAEELALDWVTLIHPSAVVAPSARIAAGTVVFAGVIVQPDTEIGAHCIVNTGATVDHDCSIGSFAHIGPGANLCGGVSVGEGVLLGVGVRAIPGIRIGAWTTVGAGGVVTRDLPGNITAVGVPARPIE